MSGTHDYSATSFRDPSGNIVMTGGEIHRTVHVSYKENYDMLLQSGLYQTLVDEKLLVSHTEVETKEHYKLLHPAQIPFISYPYEWCFSQLKDAALLTLRIQKIALQHGMTLKDASAYNVQWHTNGPVFIDTLSFEKYVDGSPWIAYKQFCQHFLAPLALMRYCDLSLNSLLKEHLDGIPLLLASSMLPRKTKWNLGLKIHLHLHARFSTKKATSSHKANFNKKALTGLLDSLENTVQKLVLKESTSQWDHYYTEKIVSQKYTAHKEKLVEQCLEKIQAKLVWDLGANEGIYSALAAKQGARVLSVEQDALVLEKSYTKHKAAGYFSIHPIRMSFTNPSPGIGWLNKERPDFFSRSAADCILLLATVHHLCIGQNITFEMLAQFASTHTRSLLIEFVPATDARVKELLQFRTGSQEHYTSQNFENAFLQHFTILLRETIDDSTRILYHMQLK